MKLRKISALFLIVVFLISCSVKKTHETEIYNTSYTQMNYHLLKREDKIVYMNYEVGQWYVFDMENSTSQSLFIDSTDALLEGDRRDMQVFPDGEDIVVLDYKSILDGDDEWVVERTNLETRLTKKIGISKKRSLINKETIKHITKELDYLNHNPYCDFQICGALESSVDRSMYIYESKMYEADGSTLRVKNLNGNNTRTIPIQLNKMRQVLSFDDLDIYYLDPDNNVRVYNQDNQENTLIVSEVVDFFIDKENIYYKNVNDGYMYKKNFEKNKTTRLFEWLTQVIRIRDNLAFYIDEYFNLIKLEQSNPDERTVIYSNVHFFELTNDSLFVVFLNGEKVVTNIE